MNSTLNSTSVLKLLLSIAYGTVVIGLIAYVAFFLYWAFGDAATIKVDDEGINYIVMDEHFNYGGLTFRDFVFLTFKFVEYLFFVLVLHYLRKSVLDMIKHSFFDTQVMKWMKLTGRSILVYAVLQSLAAFIQDLIYKSKISLNFSFSSFSSFGLLVILGLFFLLMSKVVQNGVALKVENDLTI